MYVNFGGRGGGAMRLLKLLILLYVQMDVAAIKICQFNFNGCREQVNVCPTNASLLWLLPLLLAPPLML